MTSASSPRRSCDCCGTSAAPDAVYVCHQQVEIDELMSALKGALDNGYAEAMRKELVGADVKKAG